jgi:SAM-dependent methyltransferase
VKNPYDWNEISSESFDAVVCGQMFEHAEYFWLTILEIRRVLKPNGLCCVIAPSGGAEHRFPTDCYRFYPDGMRAVARYAGLEVLEVYAQWNSALYPEMDPEWRDCVLIAKKNRDSCRFGFSLKSKLLRTLFKESRSENLSATPNRESRQPTTYKPPYPPPAHLFPISISTRGPASMKTKSHIKVGAILRSTSRPDAARYGLTLWKGQTASSETSNLSRMTLWP